MLSPSGVGRFWILRKNINFSIDSSLRISFNDKALDVIAKKSSKKDPIKEVIMYGPTHKFSLSALISFLQVIHVVCV